MIHAYLLSIFVFAHEIFYLAPEAARTPDIGLLMIIGALGVLLLVRDVDWQHCLNFFGFYVVAYLLLVVAQAAMASIYFQQSIVDGLIVARVQFYYLSYFLFVIVLRDTKLVTQFMDAFTFVALILFFIALVNYFVYPVFDHRHAAGQGARGSIVRAFIPGMEIIVAAFLWQAFKYLCGLSRPYSLMLMCVLFGAILFRQTRANIIAVLITIGAFVIVQRRWRMLIAGVALVFATSLGLSLYAGENILFSAIGSAYTEITTGEGTWGDRLRQITQSAEQASKTFWTGSGGITVRILGEWDPKLGLVARNMDLGYFVWYKYFGFPGIVLLVLLIVALAYNWLYWTPRVPERDRFHFHFALFYFVAVFVSMVTLPYLTKPGGILLVTLAMAILTTCKRPARSVATAAPAAEADQPGVSPNRSGRRRSFRPGAGSDPRTPPSVPR